MKKVYICATVYHVLISTVKVLTEKERSDIVLSPQVPRQMELYDKLKKTNLFDSVFYYENKDKFNEKYDLLTKKRAKLNTLSIIKQKVELVENYYNFEFLNDSEVFIFNDFILIGRYINMKKIKYNIIEDGLDCLRKPLFYEKNGYKKTFKSFIQTLLGIQICQYGYSQYVKTIEVNNKDGVKVVSEKKLIEKNRKKMFSQLSKEDKKQIVDIFLEKDISIDKFKNDKILLLLTQPLFSDKMLKSELEQIKLYEKMLSNYQDYKVVIKPHPRDKVDYAKYFENYIAIINSAIPVEVLGFIDDLNFDLAVTAYSTGISNLDFVKEKISFGVDYVKKFRES